MTDKIENNLLNEEEYNKYLDEVNYYYNLKKKYNKQIENIKNKIILSDKSIEEKKKIYAKQKYKCINCGKLGGSIFNESKKFLKATCGNIEEPCSLKIEIVKITPIMIDEQIIKISNTIKNIKDNIVLTKLDFLFNYIEEDVAVENFDNLKKLLENNQEIYNELYNIYINLTNNKEINDLLNAKLLEYNESIINYKEFINLYYTTNENKYLKEAIEFYKITIKPLVENIRQLKYKNNYIETIKNNDNDEIYEEQIMLFQEKYNKKDLEFIKL